ncbi:MAG: FliA/WhiG family RNA polymerase sigma factor [Candidatus Loosdrechtia sp.]|uniref:FliA/WhiG family RNA polymerase sigma factor n=1 Tax=Candidatus Loosdrechtia sp. TaxID=3101272 RepID=UPI003A64E7A0|nr:MAG: FliA/WhiG family RNA polymerase sigma factor [Candidatus Jettenia sp. AMX2]
MQAYIEQKKIAQGDHKAANREKRDTYIIKYLPLVKHVVGKIAIFLPSYIDQEDLIDVGILGLIEASERFREDMNVSFKTYAFYRIRGSVLDYLRLQDWAPRSVREKENVIKKTYNCLEQQLARTPLPEEIAEAMGIHGDELDKMLIEINLHSLLYFDDINFGNNGNSEVNAYETLKDNKSSDPLNNLELAEEQNMLESAIASLNPKERLVIVLYYYEDMLLKEIAEVMNSSVSRVSQLHHRALMSIRAKMGK